MKKIEVKFRIETDEGNYITLSQEQENVLVGWFDSQMNFLQIAFVDQWEWASLEWKNPIEIGNWDVNIPEEFEFFNKDIFIPEVIHILKYGHIIYSEEASKKRGSREANKPQRVNPNFNIYGRRIKKLEFSWPLRARKVRKVRKIHT